MNLNRPNQSQASHDIQVITGIIEHRTQRYQIAHVLYVQRSGKLSLAACVGIPIGSIRRTRVTLGTS